MGARGQPWPLALMRGKVRGSDRTQRDGGGHPPHARRGGPAGFWSLRKLGKAGMPGSPQRARRPSRAADRPGAPAPSRSPRVPRGKSSRKLPSRPWSFRALLRGLGPCPGGLPTPSWLRRQALLVTLAPRAGPPPPPYHGSDAVGRRGANGVVVGVSGCIDSAVTAETTRGRPEAWGLCGQVGGGNGSPTSSQTFRERPPVWSHLRATPTSARLRALLPAWAEGSVQNTADHPPNSSSVGRPERGARRTPIPRKIRARWCRKAPSRTSGSGGRAGRSPLRKWRCVPSMTFLLSYFVCEVPASWRTGLGGRVCCTPAPPPPTRDAARSFGRWGSAGAPGREEEAALGHRDVCASLSEAQWP